jgi:glycosyltransferase involved in cell wall biosynthesis
MQRSNKVNFIFRKRRPENFSIENIFNLLKGNFKKKYSIKSNEVVAFGGSPWVLIKNILNYKQNDGIHHITGDIHYMAIKTGKNTLLTIHDVKSIIRGNILKRMYLKIFWFWIPAIIVKKITVISEFSKGELLLIIPFAKNKIKVIPNPVSPDLKFTPYVFNQSKPNILCVGTKKNKNLIRISKALVNLNCKLTIVGKLTSSQKESLIQNKIDFINKSNLNNQEMIKTYQNCDLLCFPSTYEGFGMPIIEAQATGRPVLTSEFGAMQEVAQNTACLVNPNSVSSIREGIEKIIHNEKYRNELIKKGIKNSMRYHISTITLQYENLYNEILKTN